MKRGARLAGALLMLATTGWGQGEFLDRLDEQLTASSESGAVRARLSGTLEVEAYSFQQPAPGLAGASAAQVTARGDHGGRIVTWPATVSQVPASGEEWERIAPQLAGKRLNSPGGATATVERWTADCVVSRLVPAGDPIEAGESLPNASGAAPAGETPAARPAKRPFRLHKVRDVPLSR